MKVNIYRGSLKDVLSRFVAISKKQNADYVVRITGDCPIDHVLIDKIIKICIKGLDYLSNTIMRTFPDGIDVEVFKSEALYASEKKADDFIKEHVTPYIWKSKKINRPIKFK